MIKSINHIRETVQNILNSTLLRIFYHFLPHMWDLHLVQSPRIRQAVRETLHAQPTRDHAFLKMTNSARNEYHNYKYIGISEKM